MKNSLYLPVFTAIVGFSLAWILKPSGNAPDAKIVSDVKNLPQNTARSGTQLPKHSAIPNAENTVPNGSLIVSQLPPELVQARQELADRYTVNAGIIDSAMVARLGEILQIDQAQQEKILALFQAKRDSLNFYKSGTPQVNQNLLELAEQTEKKFNEALSSILTPTQVSQVNDFRKLQSQNRAAAAAQREYADLLEKIDVDPAQHSQIQQVLQQAATASFTQLTDKTRLFADTYDAMGFDRATFVMGESSTANAAIEAASDPAEMTRIITQGRIQEMQNKLERMKPFLTPGQMVQYKSDLERKAQDYLGSIAPHLQPPPAPISAEIKNAPIFPTEEE